MRIIYSFPLPSYNAGVSWDLCFWKIYPLHAAGRVVVHFPRNAVVHVGGNLMSVSFLFILMLLAIGTAN